MAFDSSITLDGTAGADHIYLLQSAIGSQSRRILSTSTLSEPRALEIKHSEAGNKTTGVTDRTLISISDVVLDDSGAERRSIINTTLALDRSTEITRAMVDNQILLMIDFLSDTANVDKLLRKEV